MGSSLAAPQMIYIRAVNFHSICAAIDTHAGPRTKIFQGCACTFGCMFAIGSV